jgi:hypothetical protein
VPAAAQEAPRNLSLEDFAAFLESLAREGYESVVIGGCAVGAYAALRGETVLSGDLDLIATSDTLDAILDAARRLGAEVLKRPQPRGIPTAFLRWQDKEINILTWSAGLGEPANVALLARVFELRKHPGLEVLVADPYDLLRNKITVNRPKDRPHIEVLRRFVEEEAVYAFESETSPRQRLAPARRLLEATGERCLPERLAARLVPLARLPSDFRFLANNVPTEPQARALLERAKADPELAQDLESILEHRDFPVP